MLAPLGASAQICKAPARVAPAVMPTKMPSLVASSLLHFSASGPAIRSTLCSTWVSTTSPSNLGMKSGAQPCMGCGLNAGCATAGEPSALRCCGSPLGGLDGFGGFAGEDL